MSAPDVFLSYNSADRPSIVAVQKLLQARGFTTFLDRDNLVAGLPWPQALEQRLSQVKAVAVFVGRDWGGWQKREMWFALDRQTHEEKAGRPFPVIPVLLQGADLSTGFLFLNTWIDLRSGVDSVATAEALAALDRAIRTTSPVVGGESTAAKAEERAAFCPYRGLQIFREEDAAFFVGRLELSQRLLEFTLGKDLVGVVGPSGSGKSSVVQAGLLPLLRRERPPANTWDAVSFTPGKDPFQRLASALIPLLEQDLSETDQLAEAKKLGKKLVAGEISLEAVIDRVIQKSNGTDRLLLVADQFEELFTLTPEPGRRPFAQALLGALGGAPFTLLITLRADFYSQIITLDRDLSDRLAPAQVNIGALTREQLRDSITSPAKLVGLQFESGLVERILIDVGNEPGHLPLVEFALTELCHRRKGGFLLNRAYDDIGGVTGALAKRAEAEFGRLTLEEQTAARRLFSRLVRVARPEEAGEDTRERTDLSDADTVAKRIATEFADARLLVTGGGARGGTLSVEVAHEALIRNWERLRIWLNEDREFLLWRQRLQVQVAEWQDHKEDADYLLRGAPLSEAERWLLGRQQDLTDAGQRLIRESIALRERVREAEEKRRQAEIERRKRNFRIAIGTSVLFALLAGIAGSEWHRARQSERVSKARELVAFSTESLNEDPEKSILLAMHAVNATLQFGQPPVPAAEEALHQAILSSHARLTLKGHNDAVRSVAWSPDGKRLATGSGDWTAKMWDAGSGQEVLTLNGHDEVVDSVAWSPDGKRLATASGDGTAKVWDAANGKEVLTLKGHTDDVWSVAWNPDGKRLATGSGDGTAKVWDAASGKEVLTLNGHDEVVVSVAWSPDGKRLATASGVGTAKVWDAVGGKEVLTLNGVNSVAWSPDGKQLATGSGGTAKVWNAASGQEVLTLKGHNDLVLSVAWSPDGKRLATASQDHTAKVWNAGSGKELLTLKDHTGEVDSVAWSPDGKRLATGSGDGAKVWDVGGGTEVLTLEGHTDHVWSVASSPDGKRLATASSDHTAKVWDAASGEEVLPLKGHISYVYSVAWSPDGKRLATASGDGTAKVWDAGSGTEVLTLKDHTGRVFSVAWSPDGKRLATGSGTVKVWDAASGQEVLTLKGGIVAWSPDGKRLATETKVWDAASGQEVLTLTLKDHTGVVDSVAWSPDGKRLATASWDGTAKVWDAASGTEVLTLKGHTDRVYSVAWSPDGKQLATGSADHTAKVWDAASGKEVLTLKGHTDRVSSVAWSPDGKRLATGSYDQTVQIYVLDIRGLLDLARKRVTLNFTNLAPDECRRYFQSEACPPLP